MTPDDVKNLMFYLQHIDSALSTLTTMFYILIIGFSIIAGYRFMNKFLNIFL